jgi:hypothetical protein
MGHLVTKAAYMRGCIMMKNEGFDQLSYARRIRRAGCPIHIPEDDGEHRSIPSDELLVYLTDGVTESSAFDCRTGTGIMIYVVITYLKYKIAISSLELQLPWQQTCFWWLPDPHATDGPSNSYRFFGREPLEFERSQVLNHRLNVTSPLSAGQSMRGYLLGFGDPMPADIQHGAKIPAFIIFFDQRGRDFRASLQLWADRSETKLRPEKLGAKRRKSIFDERDVIARK